MKSTRIIILAISLFLIYFVAASYCPAQITNSAGEVTRKVDELVTALNKLGPFSGAILIAKDGRILVSRGYGMANLENDAPNTSQTKFRIASVTKPFTATAIMMLQEQGKLNVQDPVSKHLVSCPEAWRQLTIHHLLTHTSGVSNFEILSDYDKTKPLYSTAASFIDRFRDTPLELQSDEEYRYSNSNYVLLGYIIEKVSGKSYEEFLRTNIFKPLQMVNTGYDHPQLELKHRAAGYIWRREFVNADFVEMSNPYAAGGLYSTIEDLFLFDQALYTEKLLSKKSLEEMFSSFEGDYGYGWEISHQFNRRAIGHGGRIDGFRANFVHFSEDRVCIIVLSNVQNTRVGEITQYLAAIALGEKYNLSEVGPPVDVTAELAPAETNSSIYDSYVGQYELPMGVFTVTQEGGKLLGQPAGEPEKAEMLSESEAKFFIRGPADVQIEFVKDDKGQVTHMKLFVRGREFQGKRIK